MKKMLFLVLFCVNLDFLWTESSGVEEVPEVSVYYVDVGQGDCTLIDYGVYEILIDAGNNWYGDDVCDFLTDKVNGKIEILIATHPDADHIGGLDIVLQNYDVGIVIDCGKSHTTKTYKDYISAAKTEKNVRFMYDADMFFELGEGVVFQVIELTDTHKDNNENSVVCRLDVLNTSFLFMADLGIEIENKFIEKFGRVDVLKVGHHGSRNSTSNLFLSTVDPSYAVISCGLDNKYGHPHKEVLDKLSLNTILTYRTDLQGTIVATTDGTDIWFNVEPAEF